MQGLEGVLGVLTGLATIVLSLGIAFWAIYWDHQKKRLQYHERQLMIERGMTPPPVMPEEKKKITPQDCLRRGTILTFLGLGFGAAAAVVTVASGEEDLRWLLGVAGAIVGFLGLGNLAYYFIARRKTVEAADNVAM